MALQQFVGRVIDNAGVARSGAEVTIRVKSSGALATIYSDQGVTTIDNPTNTDTDGSFKFFAADNDYTVTDDKGFQLGDVTLFGGMGNTQYLIKTDDLPWVNASTVLVNDSTLAFDVGANEVWEFLMIALVETALIPGFDWKFTIPAGTVYTHKSSIMFNGAGTTYHYSTALDWEDSYTGGRPALTDDPLRIRGIIENGVTAGTVQFQFAQNAVNAFDTKVAEGSYLIARQVTA